MTCLVTGKFIILKFLNALLKFLTCNLYVDEWVLVKILTSLTFSKYLWTCFEKSLILL